MYPKALRILSVGCVCLNSGKTSELKEVLGPHLFLFFILCVTFNRYSKNQDVILSILKNKGDFKLSIQNISKFYAIFKRQDILLFIKKKNLYL